MTVPQHPITRMLERPINQDEQAMLRYQPTE